MMSLRDAQLTAPRLRSGVRRRARIEALLDDAVLTCARTLVSAPAGYGKSTAVASWLQASGRRAAYVSFDERGATADGLEEGIARAVAAARDEVGSLVPALGASDATPLVVVLDDLHFVTDPDALRALRIAMEGAPDLWRWVLVTRTDPPLPLTRWRLAEELAEVGPADLAFTEPEAEELLHALDVRLDPPTLRLLVERTDGWGAGLQLAALSLRGRAGAGVRDFVERFTGRDRLVLAYMTEEVLHRLDARLHDFLMLISALDEVTAEVAALVTGEANAHELLAELERRNHFILPGRGGPEHVRLHPFFRDLLRARLEDLRPGLAERLRARARTIEPLPLASPPLAGGEPLTERERVVLTALAAGASNKAIARALGVSPNTVKTHVAHLFGKLQVHNRTEAVILAGELGLLPHHPKG
jgi:LuxR family maltose regulon positive regulatory protein